MSVRVKHGDEVVFSSDPTWGEYTEERLSPECSPAQVPEMILPPSDKPPSAAKILRHLLWVNKVRVVDGRLYLYDEQRGVLQQLDTGQEWLHLCRFFHPRVQQIVGSGTVREALIRLRNCPSIQLLPSDLNAKPFALNLINGVLDVHTLEFVDKNLDFHATYELNASYLDNVGWSMCPCFQAFCDTSLQGDETKIRLLLQVLGYVVSQVWGAKKAFMFIGEPNCGKSVILDFIKLLLGAQNVSNVPLHKLGERFSLSVLANKLVNISAEIKATPLRGIDTFKGIVAGDTLMGESKGKNAFSFLCRTKLLFAGNTFPTIAEVESGEAFVSRLCFLSFPCSISKEEQDLDLLEHLWQERDVITSLALKELSKLVENDLVFEHCEQNTSVLEEFHEQQSHLEKFIQEQCKMHHEMRISTVALYGAYVGFCHLNCFNPYPVQQFVEAFKHLTKLTSTRFREGGNPVRGFVGLSIK